MRQASRKLLGTSPGIMNFISKFLHETFFLNNPCAVLLLMIRLITLDINTVFNVSKIYRNISKKEFTSTTPVVPPTFGITYKTKKHSGIEKNEV